MSDARGTTRISELDNLESGNEAFNTLLLEASRLSPLSETTLYQSRKVSLPRIGGYLANEQLHENLLTQNKTIVGAINELKLSDGGGIVLEAGAGPHNSFFGNRWIGYAPSTEQLNAIDNGSFIYTDPITGKTEHLLVGDYWSDNPDPLSNAVKYRIACFDYYLKSAYTSYQGAPLDIHHAVIMPDTSLDGLGYRMNYESSDYQIYNSYLWSNMRGFIALPNEIMVTSTTAGSWVDLTVSQLDGLTNQDYHLYYFRIYAENIQINYDDVYVMVNNNGNISVSYTQSLPAGTQFYMRFKVRTASNDLGQNDGGLVKAQDIIAAKFGNNNILRFGCQMNTTDCCFEKDMTDYSNYSLIKSVSLNKEFGVELPTEQQVLGTSYLDTSLCINKNISVDVQNEKVNLNFTGAVIPYQQKQNQFPLF